MINFTTLLRNGERLMRLVPTVRSLLPDSGNSAEASLLKIIKQRDDTLYAKKQEIAVLQKDIRELKEVMVITHDQLKDAQNKIELLQETIGGYQS